MTTAETVHDFTQRLDALPRQNFVAATPPLLPAAHLNEIIGGPELWIKRDDLIPFGFGGNKIRGLDMLIADALDKGADTIISGAGTLSNHVRAVAMSAAAKNLNCIAVYWGEAPQRAEGNYQLVNMMEAEIRFTNNYDRSSVDRVMVDVAGELKSSGRSPYVIPRGGACALGAIGHVMAVRELLAQCQTMNITPDVIILAVGSGCTLAGWLLGSRIFNAPWRIEGITVSRPVQDARENVMRLGREAATLIELSDMFRERDVVIHSGFIGEGYGVPSVEGIHAISLCARNEAVFLDPVYTGKAMAGYLAHIEMGRYARDKCVVFLHTGGEPSLFVTQEHAK